MKGVLVQPLVCYCLFWKRWCFPSKIKHSWVPISCTAFTESDFFEDWQLDQGQVREKGAQQKKPRSLWAVIWWSFFWFLYHLVWYMVMYGHVIYKVKQEKTVVLHDMGAFLWNFPYFTFLAYEPGICAAEQAQPIRVACTGFLPWQNAMSIVTYKKHIICEWSTLQSCEETWCFVARRLSTSQESLLMIPAHLSPALSGPWSRVFPERPGRWRGWPPWWRCKRRRKTAPMRRLGMT